MYDFSVLPKGLAMMSHIVVDRASGSLLWDTSGKQYIDFATGTSTMNVGHSHPVVVKAIQDQVNRFTHTFFQQIPYSGYLEVCKRLCSMAPISGESKALLTVDGAGANEAAIKIARAFTKRNAIISFYGGFHGRTYLTSSIAGRVAPYKQDMQGLAPDVYLSPFNDIDALDTLFKYTISPSRVAAIIVEPIQGENGFIIAQHHFLTSLRALCDKHGILLIVDEVQTGFGRTGKMFALEHYRINADVITLSKSLAAGIPMSAVVGNSDIMDSLPPGSFGGTYSGTPLGCAAALAVMDIIEDEKLVERSAELGMIASAKLAGISFHDKGSMMAIPLPTRDVARDVQRRCLERGLIVLTGGAEGNIIRLLWALTIPHDLLETGLDILKDEIWKSSTTV